MGAIQQKRNALFSLRLEQGVGRLVLNERRIADLLVIDEMRLGLAELPSRLDMTAGVDRFRHQRTRLERLVVHIDDHDLSRVLSQSLLDPLLHNLETRAVDDDLVIVGEVGDERTPFLIRTRAEVANVGTARSLLFSAYEIRIFGPANMAAPQLAGRVFRAMGLGQNSHGPTAVIIDPVTAVLDETCAELGWKMPDHSGLRITDVQCSAGQVRVVCDLQHGVKNGPRDLDSTLEYSARARRFLADYEAKSLYANTEAMIEEGRIERAVRHYDRQNELHAENAFLSTRLMQLQVVRPETLADAADSAGRRLSKYPDDVDALLTLVNVHWQRGAVEKASELLEKVAQTAERRGDALESAQARCAIAQVLADSDPQAALVALQSALALRRGLPGARKMLADLQAQAGDWVGALRTRESILASEEDPRRRCELLIELGDIALREADDSAAALSFHERALAELPESIDALLGMADAQDRSGDFLSAVRTLDRAARLLQQRGDSRGAAEVIVRLGHLWMKEPGEGVATASLRFRQALMLVPGHAGALYGLADVASLEGDIPRARSALEELLRASDDGRIELDKHVLYLRLAKTLDSPTGDHRLATVYYQKALDGSPEAASEAFDALELFHTESENWGDVARILEISILRAQSDEERVDKLGRLADVVATHHGDPDRAIELLEVATKGLPRDSTLLSRLGQLYRQADAYEPLADALSRLATLETEPLALAQLYTEQGVILSAHLNRVDDAVEAYAKALGCQSDNLIALDGLVDITRERERFGELATLLERRVELSDGYERAGIQFELGQILARHLRRPQQAIEHLEGAHLSAPDFTHILRLLGDLYYEADRLDLALARYETLKALYEKDGYDEPVPAFLMQIADIQDVLGRSTDAVELLETIVEHDPDRIESYARGQEIILRTGAVEDVVRFLDFGLTRASQPDVRAYLCIRLGRLLWRELRRANDAEPILGEAARYHPEDRDLRRMRIEIGTAIRDWAQVHELLRKQLETAEVGERPALLVSLAKLAYDELDRAEQGRQFAQAALYESADYIPALTLFSDKCFHAGEWQDAHDTLVTLLRVEGIHARSDDRYRLAVCRLRLGEAEAAFDALRSLRGEGIYLPGLFVAYGQACLATDNRYALAGVVDDLVDEPDPDTVELLRAAARFLDGDPKTADAARRCWQAVLEHSKEDREAQDAIAGIHPTMSELKKTVRLPGITDTHVGTPLPVIRPLDKAPNQTIDASLSLDQAELNRDAMFEETLATLEATFDSDDDELPPLSSRRLPTSEELESPTEAAEALRGRIAETVDKSDLANLLLELAELTRDRLHNPDGAIPIFQQIMDDVPPEMDEWSEAMETLEDFYSLRANWDALLALHDRCIEAGVGGQAEAYFRKAKVLFNCERLEAAREASERALPMGDEALELLVSILQRMGRGKEGATHLLVDLENLGKVDRGHRLWRAAELLRTEDKPGSLELLERASTLISERELIADLVSMAREVGRVESLANALCAQAATLGEGTAASVKRSGLYLEAARLMKESQDDARLRSLLEKSLSAWPENVDTVLELRACLETQGDLAALGSLLEVELGLLLPGTRRGLTALRLAEIQKDFDGNDEGFEKNIRLAAADLVGTEHYARVEDLAGDLSLLVENTVSDVTDALLSRASTQIDQGGRVKDVVAILEEALGLDPACGPAYEELERLYRQAQMPEELSAVLERHAAIVGPVPERGRLWLERGLIAHERLQSVQTAIHALERVVSDSAALEDTTTEAMETLIQIRSDAAGWHGLINLLTERMEFHEDSPSTNAWLLTLRAGLWMDSLGQEEPARADFSAALDCDPDHGPALLALGQMNDLKPDVQGALIMYRRALETTVNGLNSRERALAFDGAVRCIEVLGLHAELKDFAVEVAERFPDSSEIHTRVEDLVGLD